MEAARVIRLRDRDRVPPVNGEHAHGRLAHFTDYARIAVHAHTSRSDPS